MRWPPLSAFVGQWPAGVCECLWFVCLRHTTSQARNTTALIILIIYLLLWQVCVCVCGVLIIYVVCPKLATHQHLLFLLFILGGGSSYLFWEVPQVVEITGQPPNGTVVCYLV